MKFIKIKDGFYGGRGLPLKIFTIFQRFNEK